MLEPLQFNKGIEGLVDKTSEIIKQNYVHSKLEIISIFFEEGYDDAISGELTLQVNKFPVILNSIDPFRKPVTQSIAINKFIDFNYSDMEIILNSEAKFKCSLTYKF